MSIPYNPKQSNRTFYVPKTLKSDFDRFLDTDVPNAVMEFEIFRCWQDQFEEGYEPVFIRGEIYPEATKSRYTNTENNLNFRASASSGIQKGDMIKDANGTIYLFDWEILLESNNAPTRACRCNSNLTFVRYMQEEVDKKGYLVQEGGYRAFVTDMPCNTYFYDGRPNYSTNSGAVGLTPNALIICNVQFNQYTKDIRVGDKFIWAGDEHNIINVSYAGCDPDITRGVISLWAEKAPGGDH